jgi:hypothetical protein
MRGNFLTFPSLISSPYGVFLAAAGHTSLIVNSEPAELPALLRSALVFPEVAIYSAMIVTCLGAFASLASGRWELLIRRGTIVLIALCLTILAMEHLSFLKASNQPWRFMLYGATALIAVGGIGNLIAALRGRPRFS